MMPWRRSALRVLCVLCVPCALTIAGLACGGRSGSGIGVSSGGPSRRPVELDLRTSDGVFVYVGDYRDKPVLLFLFATFDGVSQASVDALNQLTRDHADVHVIAVAVQPNAPMLVDAWTHAIEPAFLTTYDPSGGIGAGTSPLGVIEAVPTLVLLDRRGYEVARHVGFVSNQALREMLQALDPR